MSQDDQARDSTAAHTEVPKLNLRRLETIQRLLQYGAVLVLLVFLGLIVLSWFQLRGIKDEIATADASLSQKKSEILQLKKDAEKLKGENSGLQKVNGALTVVTRSIGEQSPEQAEKVKQAIEESIAPTNDVPTNVPTQVPPRIYLQIGREDQRKHAGEVARKLQAEGYTVPGLAHVPGLERVPGLEHLPGLGQRTRQVAENARLSSPRFSQIRYYQSNEVSQKDVNDIVRILQGMGVELKQVQLPFSKAVRARHYEIWFGEDF